MEHFLYRREPSVEAAVRTVRETTAAQFIAGATNLTDFMTLGVVQPRALVDINELPERYRRIDSSDTRLRLGALVRMADAEDHPAVRARFPLIQQTLALAASRQIRNMATLGRQCSAAHPLRVLPGSWLRLQQARTRIGLRRTRGREPRSRGARHE